MVDNTTSTNMTATSVTKITDNMSPSINDSKNKNKNNNNRHPNNSCSTISHLTEVAESFISNDKERKKFFVDMESSLQKSIDLLQSYKNITKIIKQNNINNNIDNNTTTNNTIIKNYEKAFIYFKIIHILVLNKIPNFDQFKLIKETKHNNIQNTETTTKKLKKNERINRKYMILLVKTLVNDEMFPKIKSFIKEHSSLPSSQRRDVQTNGKNTEPSLPDGSLISPQHLQELSRSNDDDDILLIDVRPRLNFVENHIDFPNIICIEPISFKPSYTDQDIQQKSLITSPDNEIKLFEMRNQFKFIILYTSDNNDESHLLSLLKILLTHSFAKPFDRSLTKFYILKGGILNWNGPTTSSGNNIINQQNDKPSKKLEEKKIQDRKNDNNNNNNTNDNMEDSIYIDGNTSGLSLQHFPKMSPSITASMDLSMQEMMSSPTSSSPLSPLMNNFNQQQPRQFHFQQQSPLKRTSSLKNFLSNFTQNSNNNSTSNTYIKQQQQQQQLQQQTSILTSSFNSSNNNNNSTTSNKNCLPSFIYPIKNTRQSSLSNSSSPSHSNSALSLSLISPRSTYKSSSPIPSNLAKYQYLQSSSASSDSSQSEPSLVPTTAPYPETPTLLTGNEIFDNDAYHNNVITPIRNRAKIVSLSRSLSTNSHISAPSTARSVSSLSTSRPQSNNIYQNNHNNVRTSFSGTRLSSDYSIPNITTYNDEREKSPYNIQKLQIQNTAGSNDLIPHHHNNVTTHEKEYDLDFIIGLQNMGNSCYLNCIIQCLLGTHELTKIFLNYSFERYINLNSKLGSKGVLAKNLSKLIHLMYNHSTLKNNGDKTKKKSGNNFIKPIQFRMACGSINNLFKNCSQQDCQEFCQFLLDALHEDLNQCGSNPPLKELSTKAESMREKLSLRIASSIEWERYLTTDFSVIVDLFQGQYASRLQCKTCIHTSTTYQPFSVLSVPIPKKKNLNLLDCFKDFTKIENLEVDEQWFCPNCKSKQPSTKKLTITRLPRNLIIHLKRFDNNLNKNNNLIDYPFILDLTQFWADDFDGELPPGVTDELPKRGQIPPFKYRLYGAALHFGSLYGGHYTAFVNKGIRNGWYYFDDTNYRPIKNEREPISSNAYVLFYHRIYGV
ncbi:ubiquitin-specific protease DOA4 NDAI_0A03680 [Naumovozyma dairenensis CBS 421]|uniref:ubiquitinyl hydrolase 1 n=1 Tax=Naumovozyma dairenensis (strain ATCC 10597 / BCRC 20456 / CBS 421 / NBRC 0211 / NRRL Y-12639) TaxID=1071378 RepID=G0W3Y7_NAUDC|nr:hypothetical protein NDAI_0A03680 [Naumovozyma dairenensis CBS 421]CCD22525.1 hypothetical protein NDAI_0A03680 [Naumovozyma dairenensis CBS 421]